MWGWEERGPRELGCDGHSFGLVDNLGLGLWLVCCLVRDEGQDLGRMALLGSFLKQDVRRVKGPVVPFVPTWSRG